MWNHEAIDHGLMPQTDWLGSLPLSSLGTYIDSYLLMIFGGVPWQVYFQRVLACKSSKDAQNLSYMAAVGCILLALPPAFLGSIARVAGKLLLHKNPQVIYVDSLLQTGRTRHSGRI